MTAAFVDISLLQLASVAIVTLVASLLGGVAGYGTGALVPLVLVPIVGPESTVPIIVISGLLTNTSRAAAFLSFIDWRHVLLVLVGAAIPCVVTAYGYTLLTGKNAMAVIGGTLALTVPLRHLLKRRVLVLGDRGLLAGGAGYGVAAGGTVGGGAILLSLLMAAGLEGSAVVATSATISIAIGVLRTSAFGAAGAVNVEVVALSLLIGLIAFPGAFLAKGLVARLPMRVHTVILDAIVLIGGMTMMIDAFRR
jgi:uncharacterized membrane protein YfcA